MYKHIYIYTMPIRIHFYTDTLVPIRNIVPINVPLKTEELRGAK